MARRGRRSKSGGEGEQFLAIGYPLARSEVFRSLSGAALKVWVELRTRFNGSNNGRLSLSWDEAARLLGLSKSTVGRAFDELQEKGFIELVRAGHWYGRKATEWAVTDRSRDGHLPTYAWKHWRPSDAARVRQKRKSVPVATISDAPRVRFGTEE